MFVHGWMHEHPHIYTYIHTHTHTYIHTYLPTYVHNTQISRHWVGEGSAYYEELSVHMGSLSPSLGARIEH
jgi:hypothetical protein